LVLGSVRQKQQATKTKALRRMKKNFVSQGTLDTIDQSHRACLNGRAELFRELRRKTARALRVDKEADVQGT